MSKAIETFNKTIQRSKGLLSIYDKIHNDKNFDGLKKADILRSSLVLSVSSMDTYFTSRFSERLVSFIKKKWCHAEFN